MLISVILADVCSGDSAGFTTDVLITLPTPGPSENRPFLVNLDPNSGDWNISETDDNGD
jgi:hypothetical protein